MEFATVPTLLELVQIEEALSDLLGVKVALVPEESISPFIRPSVQPIEVSV